MPRDRVMRAILLLLVALIIVMFVVTAMSPVASDLPLVQEGAT